MTAFRFSVAIYALFTACLSSSVYAGDVVTGNVFVCRKPMLASMSAALQLMAKPEENDWMANDWRSLAELQKEQAENCFYASEVNITGEGQQKVEIGWGQWCQEFTGLANGEEVFVSYGSQNRTYGKCP